MITIDQPGQYQLQGTDANGCVGKESIIITNKECRVGVYILPRLRQVMMAGMMCSRQVLSAKLFHSNCRYLTEEASLFFKQRILIKVGMAGIKAWAFQLRYCLAVFIPVRSAASGISEGDGYGFSMIDIGEHY